MKYKFEDIAINSTAKKLPSPSDNEHYIGLEHLDSGNLYVTRWGAETAPIGEKLLMKKGDVLFGKRRAYQKKVGIAPFDGIFSAHGMVLRPKENVICKEFFPFFISSDYFLNEAIRISVGGLSPTINWKDLRILEFELPSLEEQRVLADKLWAAYEVKESYKNLLAQTDKLLHAQFEKMFGNLLTNSLNLPTQKMSEVAPEIPSSKEQSGQVWQLNLDMIESKSGKIISKVYIDKDDVSSSTTAFDATNVLYSKLRPNLNKVVVPDESGYCTTELLPLKPNAKLLDRVFLATLLRNEEFVQWAINHSAGTKMPRVSLSAFREFRIIIPPMEKQLEFVRIAEQAEQTKASLNKGIEAIEAVIRSLIAEGTTRV